MMKNHEFYRESLPEAVNSTYLYPHSRLESPNQLLPMPENYNDDTNQTSGLPLHATPKRSTNYIGTPRASNRNNRISCDVSKLLVNRDCDTIRESRKSRAHYRRHRGSVFKSLSIQLFAPARMKTRNADFRRIIQSAEVKYDNSASNCGHVQTPRRQFDRSNPRRELRCQREMIQQIVWPMTSTDIHND